eukprot:gene33023-40754_t
MSTRPFQWSSMDQETTVSFNNANDVIDLQYFSTLYRLRGLNVTQQISTVVITLPGPQMVRLSNMDIDDLLSRNVNFLDRDDDDNVLTSPLKSNQTYLILRKLKNKKLRMVGILPSKSPVVTFTPTDMDSVQKITYDVMAGRNHRYTSKIKPKSLALTAGNIVGFEFGDPIDFNGYDPEVGTGENSVSGWNGRSGYYLGEDEEESFFNITNDNHSHFHQHKQHQQEPRVDPQRP